MDQEELDWYLRQAQVRWDSYECQISNNALIAATEKGAWVEAWVWISAPKYFDEESIVDVYDDSYEESYDDLDD